MPSFFYKIKCAHRIAILCLTGLFNTVKKTPTTRNHPVPDHFYPVVSAEESQRFTTLLKLAAADPTYVTAEECPYPAELRAAIQVMRPTDAPAPPPRPARPVRPQADLDSMDKWSRLELEARELFDELKAESANLGTQDVNERMSYFRTATSLLDKLVGLQERAAGLRQLSEFQNMILQFLDELCTPDQRTELMERLKSVTLTEGARRVTEAKQPVEQGAPSHHAAS
jgi:uncharacterized protein YerC